MSATLEVLSRYCAHSGGHEPPAPVEGAEEHQVLILGPGCKRCNALFELTERVLSAMGRGELRPVHVRDLDDIAAYGPVITPALVIDNKVLLSGRIPTDAALRDLLQRHLD